MAIIFACFTFVSTCFGGIAAIRLRDRLHLLLGFSSGAVIAVVLFDVIPEIFDVGGREPPVMPMVGSLTALPLRTGEALLPWLLAFFAGAFLYIGASDLLPEAREHDSPVVGIATTAGMLLMFVISRYLRAQ